METAWINPLVKLVSLMYLIDNGLFIRVFGLYFLDNGPFLLTL